LDPHFISGIFELPNNAQRTIAQRYLEFVGSRITVHGSRVFVSMVFPSDFVLLFLNLPTTHNVPRTTSFERKYRRWTKLAFGKRWTMDEVERWTFIL